MTRRGLVAGPGMSFTAPSALVTPSLDNFSNDGATFRAWHANGRLSATFTAPTHGWVASGVQQLPSP